MRPGATRAKRKRPSGEDDADASIRLSARYLDEFVRLQCAPMLLEAGVFPDAKEISEAMAAFNAYRQFVMPNVPLRSTSDASSSSSAAGGVPQKKPSTLHRVRGGRVDATMRQHICAAARQRLGVNRD